MRIAKAVSRNYKPLRREQSLTEGEHQIEVWAL